MQTPEEIKAKQAEYRAKNREKLNAKQRERDKRKTPILTEEQKAHRNRLKCQARYARNREARLAKMKEYQSRRSNTSWGNNIRNRLNAALKHTRQYGRVSETVRALGCSIDEFRAYIAGKFTEGMSWENYGEWQLDHIKSLSKFDLYDPKQYAEACHYTNYQPLWKLDNQKKGAR